MNRSVLAMLLMTNAMLPNLAQGKTLNNIALVSDYVWRGVSQTDNGPALQGGVDYTNGNAYGGVWFSNVEDGANSEGLPVEMDVAFGYNNKFNGFNLDTSVITYNYLNDNTPDRTEFRLASSISKEIEIAIHREVKTKYWYPEIVFEKYLDNRLYLDASVGYWSADGVDDDAFTFHAELARDFPEFQHLDIFIGVSFISDKTPLTETVGNDDEETLLILGLRKRF